VVHRKCGRTGAGCRRLQAVIDERVHKVARRWLMNRRDNGAEIGKTGRKRKEALGQAGET